MYKRKLPKPRNPMARFVRTLRPQRVRSCKAYTRKGRRKAPDVVSDPPLS